jgi:transcriptional regulator with XRE-family HTH domain
LTGNGQSGNLFPLGLMTLDRRKRLGIFLAKARKAAKLSQRDAAVSLGYSSTQFISNWERGLSSPPISSLHALAKIYEISAERLYEEILDYNLNKVREELDKQFYGKARSSR